MSKMVERAARAHFEERGFVLPGDADWEQIGPIRQATLVAKMRAAIEAMREPTPEMNAAGNLMDSRLRYVNATDVWSAMIDAALKDDTNADSRAD